MIALILFINLSAIYCQTLFPDDEYSPTFKRFISPSLQQKPLASSFGNLRSKLPFHNGESIRNFEESTGLTREGQGPLPRSIFAGEPHSHETLLRAKLSPRMLEMLQSARSISKPSFKDIFPSNTPIIFKDNFPSNTPIISPPVTSSIHSPRPAIPSPLTLTDSIPSPYLEEDPIISPINAKESILTSNIGCLDLTVTPYGTISETPLPDPSIPIPRSPFLPVSSPVSALAPPLSPFLPPASPACKGSNFLRKVPVPPPFI